MAAPKPDNSNGQICRLCRLNLGRFDEMLKTPRYKLGPSGKRIMKRMDRAQRKVLMTEFERDRSWSPERVETLAARLSVSKQKIYKWNWDQKNKEREAIRRRKSLKKRKV